MNDDTLQTSARDWNDRVAIVTGAGKGLGRAYALQLANLGAKVLVNNRSHPDQANTADAVVSEIRKAGGEAQASYCSVEEQGSGKQLVAEALEHFGCLDIILANAGMDQPQSFHNQTLEDFEEIFEINFHGTSRLLHAAWPVMRAAGYGRLLVSTSTAGLYGNHGQAAYAASKAALLGLMRSLAIEGQSRGLLINALSPYAVTPLTRAWFPEQQIKYFAPESVAPLAAFLLSEQCTLTGKCIIAGAGAARMAQVQETKSLSLDAELSVVADQLLELPCQFAPHSASFEFEQFTRALDQSVGYL